MRLLSTLLFSFTCLLSLAQSDYTYTYSLELRYEGSNVHISPNYQYRIEKLVDTLMKNSQIDVHIRGHVCCGPGKRLSKRRAKKVYKLMVRSGIDKSRLSFKGYSNTAPAVFPEKKEEDEQRNRRVDFIFTIRTK